MFVPKFLNSGKVKRRPLTLDPRMLDRYQHVEQPDAVNQTLRASGYDPLFKQKKEAELKMLQQLAEKKRQVQHQRRTEYRLRMQKQSPVGLPVVLTDQQVDQALAAEDWQRAHPQPEFRLGMSKDQEESLRKAGLYFTNEDRERAKNLAYMHNNFLLGQMSDPQIDPEWAYRNPGAMQSIIHSDAGILPNAFMTGLTMGAPSATGAAWNGMKAGWQTAGNYASKAWNATVQGAKSAAPVVTNPRWVATTATVTAPAVADAQEMVAGDGGATEGNGAWPWVIGGIATVGGTAYLYNKFKGAGRPNWAKLWESSPEALANEAKYKSLATRYNEAMMNGDRAAINALKGEVAPAATGVSAGDRALMPVMTDEQLKKAITSRSFAPVAEGSLIDMNKGWRNFRNWGVRMPLYGGAAGYLGWNLFGNNGGSVEPAGPIYESQDTTGVANTDTVPAVPRMQDATTDSIDKVIQQAIQNGGGTPIFD